jgi:hypothetical protein
MGDAGTGKTYSVGTLVETGLEVFYLGLESGVESLIRYFTDKNKAIPENLHWCEVKAGQAGFSELIDSAKKLNVMSYESLTKATDPSRSKHTQFIDVLNNLHDFLDQRSGKRYGSVSSWDTSRVLVIDGLTGLSNFAMSNWMGGKITRDQKDWGIAQNALEQLLRQLVDGCQCHIVLLSHIERETDQVLGGTKITLSTLGRALAPKVPAMFSDVILCTRSESSNWYWDNRNGQATVKFRNLPYSATNPADFRPLIENWRKNKAAFEAAMSAAPASVAV